MEKSTKVLERAASLYVFVSTVSVYSDFSTVGIDESAPVLRLDGDSTSDGYEDYGRLKAACEDEVRKRFRRRALIVRPGVIVGPHDPTNRFTYWVTRADRGGRILAPLPRQRPVQFIDARDLSEWTLKMVESGQGGTFNAVCPSISFGELIDACLEVASREGSVEWVDPQFLVDERVEPWTELPLWLLPNGEFDGFMSIDPSKALKAGLRIRPLEETISATLSWARSSPDPPAGALSAEKEAHLLNLYEQRPE